jgi:hypothetical protein
LGDGPHRQGLRRADESPRLRALRRPELGRGFRDSRHARRLRPRPRRGGAYQLRPARGDRGARLPPEGAARLAGLSEEDRAAAERARALTDAGSGPRRLGDHDDGEDLASARRDSIRWSPIWAGLITALTTFLLLQLLAIGLGLVDVGPGSDGGGGWVPALIGLIAFFTGGAVAGMTSAIRGTGTGLLNGFMVWALGTVLILLLSALGLGQLFGALGNVAGQVGPGALSNAANSAQGAAPNISPQDAEQAIRTGAIGAFFGLLFSALASMLGGLLGGRSRDPLGRPTDARRD